MVPLKFTYHITRTRKNYQNKSLNSSTNSVSSNEKNATSDHLKSVNLLMPVTPRWGQASKQEFPNKSILGSPLQLSPSITYFLNIYLRFAMQCYPRCPLFLPCPRSRVTACLVMQYMFYPPSASFLNFLFSWKLFCSLLRVFADSIWPTDLECLV